MNIEHELIIFVSEELSYLTDEWTQDIDDASLRRTSPVLRSLLIEGQLMKVANMLREKINIMAPLTSKYDNELDCSSIVYYQSGGAIYKGMKISSIKQISRAMTPEELRENCKNQEYRNDQSYSVKLTKFMKQISFVINGTKITRDEVIKYIANKKGGAHFDGSRGIEKSGQKGELERKYTLLDGIHDGTVVASKSKIYYELLSIGQRLIGSYDVQRVRQIIVNCTKRSGNS